MAIGFKVKYFWYQIGAEDFLHAFFSNICYHLENKKWGSKYNVIMNKLYSGELRFEDINNALNELDEIKNKLKLISPNKVIWDIDNLDAKPPWGNNISAEITDLSNYFVTSDGEDFITILQHALEKAASLKTSLEIESI